MNDCKFISKLIQALNLEFVMSCSFIALFLDLEHFDRRSDFLAAPSFVSASISQINSGTLPIPRISSLLVVFSVLVIYLHDMHHNFQKSRNVNHVKKKESNK